MLVNQTRIENQLSEFQSYVPMAISKFDFHPPGAKGTLSYMKEKVSLFGENFPAFIKDLESKGNEILKRFSESFKDEAPTLKNKIEECIKAAATEYKKIHWN